MYPAYVGLDRYGSSDPLRDRESLPMPPLVSLTGTNDAYGKRLNPFKGTTGSEVANLVEHGIRTANIAVAISHVLDIPHHVISDIESAARLHDIGKTEIDPAILNKPGPLDAAEWAELKRHPQIGYDIIHNTVDRSVARMVLMHHERLDGHGYPNGLSAGSIEVPLRILHVADAFDAITSHRPYQPAMPVAHAVSELTDNIGTQFDGDVVHALLELVGDTTAVAVQTMVSIDRFAAVG